MQVSDASDLHAQRWKGSDSSKQNRGVKEPHSFMCRPSRCVLRGPGGPCQQLSIDLGSFNERAWPCWCCSTV